MMSLYTSTLECGCTMPMASLKTVFSKESLTEQVYILIDRITLDSREAQLLYKFTTQILYVNLFRTNLQCFLLCGFEVLLLPYIGHEADHIEPFLDEPGEDAARVEATAVGETDFFFSHCGNITRIEHC